MKRRALPPLRRTRPGQLASVLVTFAGLVTGPTAFAQAPNPAGADHALAPLQLSVSSDSDGLVIRKPSATVYRDWRSGSQWQGLEIQQQRYAQGSQKLDGRSIALVGQEVDPASGLGHGWRLGWSDGPYQQTAVADGYWSGAWTPRTQWGVFGTHDVVESIAALRDQVTYTLVGANIDHSPVDGLTLVAAGSATRFSDSQDRRQLRLRAIWDALPSQGITLQLHLKHQTGERDAPVRRYFNPGQLDEAQAVVGWRRRWEGWQFIARAGTGAQWVNEAATEPVRTAELQVQSPVRGQQFFKLRWGFSQTQGLSGPGYIYRSADLNWVFRF